MLLNIHLNTIFNETIGLQTADKLKGKFAKTHGYWHKGYVLTSIN